MATPVEVPKLGNSVEECLISRWMKHRGDPVATGDVVAEIETDKATFEVTSPVDGTLLEAFSEEGVLVPVFTNLFGIGKPGESVDGFRPSSHAGNNGAVQLTGIEHFGKHELFFAEGRRWFDPLYFYRQLVADKDFAAGDEPLHVRRLDVMGIEQIAARPNYRRCPITKTAELFALELGRMFQMIDRVVNIALARPALEENRYREELLAFFDGAKQARRRDFSYVPLSVQVLVVPFA